ncbi:proline--tRNA ligase [Candidatus Pacearchaeota archaeon]|nr:proline--tRNA ligase [Candidatus Pacearchaeota archaeon]
MAKETFNINKEENFSDWYSSILDTAKITDIRYNVKGFVVIRPWGAQIIEKMYQLYEKELQKKGHVPSFFPTVIPEGNFKKESCHVKGFSPEVFWLEKTNDSEEKLALRPTSETAFYQLYNLWISSYRDLPLKIYQRANVFRLETKATRPLIRGREFLWIESHNAFATLKEAENQVTEDINITETIMHKKFLIPFLPMKRPDWDKFPGSIYTIGSDTIMPDGKIIQQPSTHLLGQNFSKAFDVKFKTESESEEYVYQTCYGPAISRILSSVIAMHGDDSGLILPFIISPIQIVIVPIYSKKNSKKILQQTDKIKENLENQGFSVHIDSTDKRPGEKFFFWEMKGVPFRIELGEKELNEKKVTFFIRDKKEKIKLLISKLEKEIPNLASDYDMRLLKKADKKLFGSIIDCNSKDMIKKALNNKKIARFNFCNSDKSGEKCAEFIEKELSSRVMGTRHDKIEKPTGKCIICNKKSNSIVYAGKSY